MKPFSGLCRESIRENERPSSETGRSDIVRAASDRENTTVTMTDKGTIVTGSAARAVVRVVSGPARSGKTARLLERCCRLAARGPATFLWLTPTLRRADQLRGSLGSVPGLLLLTFDELAGELLARGEPETRPLSCCQARLVLDEVLDDLHRARKLGHFDRVADTRGFAEIARDLLGELQRQDVVPDSLVVDVDDQGKLRQCARLFAVYRQRLRS